MTLPRPVYQGQRSAQGEPEFLQTTDDEVPGHATALMDGPVGAGTTDMGAGLLGTGGTALWAQMQRHGGYVDLGTASYSKPGCAIARDGVEMHMTSGAWLLPFCVVMTRGSR